MGTFDLNRLPEYSREELLKEIRRVSDLVEGEALTHGQFKLHARVHNSTLRNHFGSWKHALEAAGLGHRYTETVQTQKSGGVLARRMSDEEILELMKKCAARHGSNQLRVEVFESEVPISRDTLRRRFGSWAQALKKAGLEPVNLGRRYTDEECFTNLFEVWTHYGRPPQHDEMNLPPSKVGPKAYIVRWKTWNRTLHAFVERMNSDLSEAESSPEPQAAVNAPKPEPKPTRQSISESERRDIRLGLRWEVMKRDRFRCVLCGHSPSTHPSCTLHVDHIHPFSKGGKTVSENLRTLCESCNLGKGAKIE